MHRSDNESTIPSPADLSGVDARRAGWALSGVTVLVLVVGLLVIRSTRSETNDPEPSGTQRAALIEARPKEPRQRTIVLEPAVPTGEARRLTDPRVLPATGTTGSEASTRSATAGRQETSPYDRL